MRSQASFIDKMKRVDWLVEQAKWAEMTLPKRGICLVDDETALMDREYFEELGEYSASLPTGTYIGKRWKRNLRPQVPKWECEKCHTKFVGWGTGPCSECDGKLKSIKPSDDWWMGEYYEIDSQDEIGIKWRKILVV